ncbi:MAG: hypothetical protein HWE27_18730 [Gammaproteobacteria bacterium]|nr:hypothetical protein [Gammaproteobacteria bacterium]
MNSNRWTWRPTEYPEVVEVVNSKPFDWRRLDSAGGYNKGIVFTVCAGLSMVREAKQACAKFESGKDDDVALSAIDNWIDCASEENLDKIQEIAYTEENGEVVAELSHSIWWLLRSAMAHPDGCGEIEWAFESVYEELEKFGLSYEWLANSAIKGLMARMEQS